VPREPVPHEVRTDEPGPAGDEQAHGQSLDRHSRRPSRQWGSRGVFGRSLRRTE
jgi:hypothetical protein